MSLWLPRTSPTLLVRYYSLSQRAQLINTLAHRPHPTAHRASGLVVSSRRLQSSKTPAEQNDQKDSSPKPAPPVPKDVKQVPLMTRAWKKVKHEAAHYWHGSKLLVSEVRISGRLQWKILQGDSLTRRERRQVCIVGYLCKIFADSLCETPCVNS